MRCWWRFTHGHARYWHEGQDIHLEWIHAYFNQPIRDHPVWVVGRDVENNWVRMRCRCDSNEKITGRVEGDQVEIVWIRRDRATEEEIATVLARYP